MFNRRFSSEHRERNLAGLVTGLEFVSLVQGYLAIRERRGRRNMDGVEIGLHADQEGRVLSKAVVLVLRLPAIWRPCVSARKAKLKRLAED